MSNKIIKVEVYERDLETLKYLVPSTDEFKDKFRVILSLVQGYEDKVARGDK